MDLCLGIHSIWDFFLILLAHAFSDEGGVSKHTCSRNTIFKTAQLHAKTKANCVLVLACKVLYADGATLIVYSESQLQNLATILTCPLICEELT